MPAGRRIRRGHGRSIESADNCVVPDQSGSNTLLATIATAPAIIDVIFLVERSSPLFGNTLGRTPPKPNPPHQVTDGNRVTSSMGTRPPVAPAG